MTLCLVYKTLQLGKNSLRSSLLNRALGRLLSSIDDLSMVHSDSIPISALPSEPTNALGELDLRIASKDDEIILHPVGLAPSRHDPRIIVGNHNNLVDALRLELLLVLDEGGDVGDGAGGREGARHRDEDDLLVLELGGGVVLLGDAARGDLAVLGGQRGVAEGDALGEAIANFELGHGGG